MNRDELLTKLAMELAEWPNTGGVHGPCYFIPSSNYYGPGHTDRVVTIQGFTKNVWLDERKRLINKPSWDTVPKCFEWIAQDSDGTWYGYRNKPRAIGNLWYGSGLNAISIGETPAGHDWRESLEQRSAETIPPKDTVDDSELHWDGTSWPPPEGARVEVKRDSEDGFCEAEVVLVGKSLTSQAPTVAAVKTAFGETIFLAICHKGSNIRPIRTTEQKAIESLANVLEQYGINYARAVASRAIYDAIRDNKIPGVKVEDL